MGLKSGSRDAELDEVEDDDEEQANQASTTPNTSDTAIESFEQETATEESEITQPTGTGSNSGTERSGNRPSMNSIPYKLRREKVNEGRDQVPFFLRDEVIGAEDEFQGSLEEMLGENVYKSDYREAAMVVAHRNPELVAEVLREWGYDLE